MRIRNIRLSFWLPCLIFPMTVATWVQYWLSVRASDDSPASWYWYGGLWSACLNFPAFVYSRVVSAPFRLVGLRSFVFGRLWLEPETLVFFPMVVVFWYWIGKNFDEWLVNEGRYHPNAERRIMMLGFYGTSACFWGLITVGLIYDMASAGYISSWHLFTYFLDRSLQGCAHILWSVALAILFARRFRRKLVTHA